MKAIELLKWAMKEIGADGLYTNDCDEPCGCSLDDLAPCGCDPSECVMAKRVGDKFYPMEGYDFKTLKNLMGHEYGTK
jgi:hypothetical protein